MRLHRGILLDVNVLVLDRAPVSFNEDVVKDATMAIHANANLRRFQLAGEILRSELNAIPAEKQEFARAILESCSSSLKRVKFDYTVKGNLKFSIEGLMR